MKLWTSPDSSFFVFELRRGLLTDKQKRIFNEREKYLNSPPNVATLVFHAVNLVYYATASIDGKNSLRMEELNL